MFSEAMLLIFSTPAQAVLYVICIIVLLLVMKGLGFTVKKGEGFYFKEREKKGKTPNRRAGDVKEGGTDERHPSENCRRIFDRIEAALTENNLERIRIETALKGITLDYKKLLFYSNAPNILRLQAGLEAIKAGENGAFKATVLSEAVIYAYEYKCITANHSELFVEEIKDQIQKALPENKINREGEGNDAK